MAGGRWTTQNKVRPGLYSNTVSDSLNVAIGGERGVVTMPWTGGFGPVGKIIELDAMTNFTNVLGYAINAPEMLTIREALKRASRLLLFRIGSGVEATANAEGLVVTALHPGVRGNDISIRILADADNVGSFNVQTFLDTLMVDSQRVTEISELQPNNFVTFSGEGELAANAGITLIGGEDMPTTTADYTEYFSEIETQTFNTMALPIEDESVKQLAVAFIQRLRNDEGQKCQLVVSGVNADSEAVINVKNGVILSDETEITANLATAWVAGATAGANVNESNTYTPYDGAIDVNERYTNSEIVEALQNGEFVFTERRGRVVVEQDINSLITFTTERNQMFAKNRVIRVIDNIETSAQDLFAITFIGNVTNNEDGRRVLKGAIVSHMNFLQSIGAIENFTSEAVEVLPGDEKDAVVVNIWSQPTDAMEKAYLTNTVR